MKLLYFFSLSLSEVPASAWHTGQGSKQVWVQGSGKVHAIPTRVHCKAEPAFFTPFPDPPPLGRALLSENKACSLPPSTAASPRAGALLAPPVRKPRAMSCVTMVSGLPASRFRCRSTSGGLTSVTCLGWSVLALYT